MKTTEEIICSIDEVTEEQAEKVRNGEATAHVTTKKSRWGYYVARRKYVTRHIGRDNEGNRAVWDETEYKVEALNLNSGKWQALTNELARVFDPEESRKREEKARERREKAAATTDGIEVGDVFSSCWGYEQTNVEFYEVVKKSGQYVTVREIASDYEETGYMSGTVTPRRGEYVTGWSHIKDNERGKRCKVDAYGGIRIDDVISAWKWDGKPEHTSSYA